MNDQTLKASDITIGISEDDQSLDDLDIEQGTYLSDITGIEDKDEEKVVDSTTDTVSNSVDDASIPEAREASAASTIGTDTHEVDVDGKPGGKVLLPQGDGKPPLAVATTCAICLEQYQEGETVVWSGNPLCRHAFHQNCILDYLVYENQEAAPCPCCRQIFLPMK